jgi:hypothetical protein
VFSRLEIRTLVSCFALSLSLSLFGCATAKLDTHAIGASPLLLQSDIPGSKVLVVWGTAWRGNQKEGARREEIASQAILEFFKNKLGHEVVVQKTIEGKLAIALSDYEILQSDEIKAARYQKVIILRLEELGPTLSFYLSPILWHGSTDILFRVRVLDVPQVSLASDMSVHWTKGGPFVLRGTSALKEGLKSALAAVF